jgi:hypothetical protein
VKLPSEKNLNAVEVSLRDLQELNLPTLSSFSDSSHRQFANKSVQEDRKTSEDYSSFPQMNRRGESLEVEPEVFKKSHEA